MTDDEVPQAQEPALHILLVVEDDGEIGAFLTGALREITPIIRSMSPMRSRH